MVEDYRKAEINVTSEENDILREELSLRNADILGLSNWIWMNQFIWFHFVHRYDFIIIVRGLFIRMNIFVYGQKMCLS